MPIQTAIDSISNSQGSPFGFKNRIINGAMVIDQRNAGASVTPTVSTAYTLDRWAYTFTQASKASIQQNAGSITPPAGFTNYLGLTSLSAYSVLSSDIFTIAQFIEGFNTADLNWGTANAKTVTLSFQVYSSLTGTFGGALQNSAVSRSYPFTYSIPTANTWTTIIVTIAGDNTGTWIGATNGVGLRVWLGVGVGSTYSGTAGAWAGADYRSATGATSVVGTNTATFYITGVQLEKGTQATAFDYRDYGNELRMCQRYCPVFDFSTGDQATGDAANTTLSDYALRYPVTIRTAATGITTSGTFGVSNYGGGFNSSGVVFQQSGTSTVSIRATTTAGSPTISQGVGTVLYSSSAAKIIVNGCEL